MTGLFARLGTASAAFLVCFLFAELFVRSCVSVRNVGPSFTTYDAEYGKAIKPGISVTRYTPEFDMVFTSNSDGFRGPEISSLEAGSILFVGDSFTMGYGVTDGKEFPALVRDAIESEPSNGALQVINAGMGDNGNGRPLIFLASDAARFNPKLIVLQIHENDFWDNGQERFFVLGDDGELERRPVPGPSKAYRLQQLIELIPGLAYSHLIGMTRQLRLRRTAAEPDGEHAPVSGDARPAAEDELMKALLDEIIRTVQRQGWPLLVVLTDIQDTTRRAMLERFLNAREIRWLAIPSAIERPELYYRVDGHWNDAGQAYAAKAVLEALKDFGL